MRPDLEPGAICLIVTGKEAGTCVTLVEFVGCPTNYHFWPPGYKSRNKTARYWVIDRELKWHSGTPGKVYYLPLIGEHRLIRIDNFDDNQTESSKEESSNSKTVSGLAELYNKKVV